MIVIGLLIDLPQNSEQRGGETELFNQQKRRIEGSRLEFVYRGCRIINRIDREVNSMKPEG